jgi:hypothetical protein
MEKELKRKEIVIAGYEIRVKDLNHKLAGDHDRIKVMAKMQQ